MMQRCGQRVGLGARVPQLEAKSSHHLSLQIKRIEYDAEMWPEGGVGSLSPSVRSQVPSPPESSDQENRI